MGAEWGYIAAQIHRLIFAQDVHRIENVAEGVFDIDMVELASGGPALMCAAYGPRCLNQSLGHRLKRLLRWV